MRIFHFACILNAFNVLQHVKAAEELIVKYLCGRRCVTKTPSVYVFGGSRKSLIFELISEYLA